MFGFALPAHTSGLSAHVIAYNLQTLSSIAYDEVSISVFAYDLAFIPPAHKSENRSVGTGGIFANFAEFLAAKTGVPLSDKGLNLVENHLRVNFDCGCAALRIRALV